MIARADFDSQHGKQQWLREAYLDRQCRNLKSRCAKLTDRVVYVQDVLRVERSCRRGDIFMSVLFGFGMGVLVALASVAWW